jgi:hypothetical protein
VTYWVTAQTPASDTNPTYAVLLPDHSKKICTHSAPYRTVCYLIHTEAVATYVLAFHSDQIRSQLA